MFQFAILIGIFSYSILAVGLVGLLTKPVVFLITSIFACIALFLIKNRYNPKFVNELKSFTKDNRIYLFILLLLFFVNLIAALGPETSFDALWYHLTIPKIFIQEHKIFFINGSLFYYSVMPKLMEMIYIPILMFSNEIVVKILSLIFSLFSLAVVYKISRFYLNRSYSLLSSIIFYSNIVVAWQSTTSYIDIYRTFFEAMSFLAFILWRKGKGEKFFYLSSVILGLSISSKLIAIASLIIFVPLIYAYTKRISTVIKFVLVALLIPLPWFSFAFISTGNPIYPLITGGYPTNFSPNLLSPINFMRETILIFTRADDPISPIYLVVFPLVLGLRKIFKRDFLYLVIYSSLGIVVWYLTPRTGGGRFLMPYLPVMSVLVAIVIYNLENKITRNILILLVIIISLITILYRGIASMRYLPVILGKETEDSFLEKNLNFSFGDFYDTDGYFKNHLKEKDRVLLFGFHNLYYADFNFIDSSYVKKGDRFTYIATQDSILPKRFSFWRKIYYNPKTHVSLYSLGGQEWVY